MCLICHRHIPSHHTARTYVQIHRVCIILLTGNIHFHKRMVCVCVCVWVNKLSIIIVLYSKRCKDENEKTFPIDTHIATLFFIFHSTHATHILLAQNFIQTKLQRNDRRSLSHALLAMRWNFYIKVPTYAAWGWITSAYGSLSVMTYSIISLFPTISMMYVLYVCGMYDE